MSDLVERLRRAFDADSVAEKNLAIRAAYDFIAAMQTDAAPALKPAVEVWEEAYQAYTQHTPWKRGRAYDAAAAVIEADRAAAIAAKDAEIAALQAYADALAEELRQIEVDAMEHYNDWMEHGCEKVEATRFVFDLGAYAREALRAYEEFSRD